jgi:hypothetical protein
VVAPPAKPGDREKNPDGSIGGIDLYEVPWGSYDPSIDAQRRAAERGLSDLREDSNTASVWAKKDLGQSLSDIKRSRGRNVNDLRRGRRREVQKLGFRRQDLRRDAGRARQDFGSRREGIARQFRTLAGTQMEARNAAGTLQGGTAAAAAAKRAENQAFAMKPIDVAENRMEQDLATSLGRIQVSQNQLNQDTGRAIRRGGVDTRRDVKLTKRDFGRDEFSRERKLGRGIREQKIGDADLLAQAIDSARQRNPGVFGKFGKKKGGRV